jgi:hypothetical protein
MTITITHSWLRWSSELQERGQTRDFWAHDVKASATVMTGRYTREVEAILWFYY